METNMGQKLVSWLRGLSPVELGLLFTGAAWFGIVLTMGLMIRTLKGALLSGVAFLVPLVLAVVVAQRYLVEPAKRKLEREKDVLRPKMAAVTLGLLISLMTVVMMMVTVTVGYGLVEAVRNPEGLSALFDPTKLAVNILSIFYVTAVGVVIGSWVWIPIGVCLACWMHPENSQLQP